MKNTRRIIQPSTAYKILEFSSWFKLHNSVHSNLRMSSKSVSLSNALKAKIYNYNLLSKRLTY